MGITAKASDFEVTVSSIEGVAEARRMAEPVL
jgi:hypothetical protein